MVVIQDLSELWLLSLRVLSSVGYDHVIEDLSESLCGVLVFEGLVFEGLVFSGFWLSPRTSVGVGVGACCEGPQ